MESDPEIFNGKTFSSLAKDIYFNSNHKKDQINQLIKDLHTMVKDVGSATVIAPMIKDYLDVGIKNDDQLVKLSAVLQRYLSNATGGDASDSGGLLSETEKEELLNNVRSEMESSKKQDLAIDKELQIMESDVEKKLKENKS
jgi:hypothetical protein